MESLVRIPQSESTATLEVLNNLGVRPMHFKRVRTDKDYATGVASVFLGLSIPTSPEDFKAIRAYVDREKTAEIWKIIEALTKFEGITLTVPHVVCQHRIEDVGRKYQLRCWKGGNPGNGHESDGHVDGSGGRMLFELFLDEKLNSCDCCFQADLKAVGIREIPGYWFKREVRDGFQCKIDVITLTRSK
jgi:hypothetical protein